MHKADARVRRTMRLLHESLGSLMHERPYEQISVQQILGRAEVSRSTFYSHFRDKEDLLVRAISQVCDEAWESARRLPVARRALGFAGPVFRHIAKLRETIAPALPPAGHAAIHVRLRAVVEQRVLRGLQGLEALASWPGDAQHLPAELRARHITGTFLTVLEWWLASDPPLDAHEAEAVFLRLVEGEPGR